MGEEIWYNPPVCPECRSHRVAFILYGLPDWDSKELMQKVKEGHVILGGCGVPSLTHLIWKCKDCGETTAVKLEDEVSQRDEPESSGVNFAIISEKINCLAELVSEAKEEMKKMESGDRADGVRMNQLMQDIQAAAEEVRGGLELQDEEAVGKKEEPDDV